MDSTTANKLIGLAFFIAVPASSYAKVVEPKTDKLPASFAILTDEPDDFGFEMMSQPSFNAGGR